VSPLQLPFVTVSVDPAVLPPRMEGRPVLCGALDCVVERPPSSLPPPPVEPPPPEVEPPPPPDVDPPPPPLVELPGGGGGGGGGGVDEVDEPPGGGGGGGAGAPDPPEFPDWSCFHGDPDESFDRDDELVAPVPGAATRCRTTILRGWTTTVSRCSADGRLAGLNVPRPATVEAAFEVPAAAFEAAAAPLDRFGGLLLSL
jgi:hypothetical protein